MFSKQSQKDAKLLSNSGVKDKVHKLLKEISINPLALPTKKLVGNLDGKYSRRINLKHRLVYEILEERKIVKVLRMWSHYE